MIASENNLITKIGIDVGNYDTKTQDTITPSGYHTQKIEPSFAEEWILYDGTYYIPREERFPYTMDKTENGRAFILSLFGIAKQILAEIERIPQNQGIGKQHLIDQRQVIHLGIGLPPGHFDALRKKTKEYYTQVFKEGVSFQYNHYSFHIRVENVEVFPQDFMAVWKNPNSEIVKTFDKYYIIGIGGYTVDIVLVKNRKVDPPSCRSLPLGTTVMYEAIIKEALKEQVNISADAIERVLEGRDNFLDKSIVQLIEEQARLHTENIIDSCITANVRFHEAPVVYYGGGCLLLKKYLMENRNVKKFEIIEDVKANAKYYARFLQDR